MWEELLSLIDCEASDPEIAWATMMDFNVAYDAGIWMTESDAKTLALHPIVIALLNSWQDRSLEKTDQVRLQFLDNFGGLIPVD
jgi:hypothetical protein